MQLWVTADLNVDYRIVLRLGDRDSLAVNFSFALLIFSEISGTNSCSRKDSTLDCSGDIPESTNAVG
ncbi:hypothetical protein TNCT_319511 [Trichonephila clavata]|uniref:Uncharacterized protein n=1 Tax=Trichonephila clavata TaxID=2740835 RepID=A0A8X6G832_TRICU|nr:hypothetical protein TNCT_319511 [Trichonephila clavata]